MAAAAPSAQADETFGVTIPDQYLGADYQVFFPEVVDATELVSISAGTVNTGEFGSMVISAIYEDENNVDQYFQIFSSGNFGFPFFATNPLSNYTGNNFTPFDVPLDIKGLRIESSGAPNQSATLLLPAGTLLTFAVVPEPTATTLIFSALLLVAFRRNVVFRGPESVR